MKKFFGRDKPKQPKHVQGSNVVGITSVHAEQTHAVERASIRASSDDPWDLVSDHDGTSPVSSNPIQRAVSPLGLHTVQHSKAPSVIDRDREANTLRKKPPGAPHQSKEQFDDTATEYSYREEKKEKKGFWERARERDKNREKEREREKRGEESQAEITRMIGYLTATASEDWSLVLEVCERSSANEANAKEAVNAIRREFKYAEPPAQLSAARLWAIMLRNCKELFIQQCASRKFLDTLEDVLQRSHTSPVVRERLLEVLAGAAYASPPNPRHEYQGFRALWRKVKPPEKPEDGIPFDTDDAMFNPPVSAYPQQYPAKVEQPPRPPAKHKPSSRNRVIPPEEDMRRLFQECKVGKGNATLLSDALAFAKPEDLKQKDIIKEFYARCRASQELIYVQIPWASAGAERSRQVTSRGSPLQTKRTYSNNESNGPKPPRGIEDSDSQKEPTPEEQLLAALLDANEELIGALRLYDDLERVGMERDAEERSRKETRIDRTRLYQDGDSFALLEPPPHTYGAGASSHSTSPSPSPSLSPAQSVTTLPINHSYNNYSVPPVPINAAPVSQQQYLSTPSLATPPPPPHGPRLPTHSATRSRTPSPDRNSVAYSQRLHYHDGPHDTALQRAMSDLNIGETRSSGDWYEEPVRPSAKALGKRKLVVSDEADSFDPNELFYEHANESRHSNEHEGSDSGDGPYQHWHQQPVHYAYDAAAERMKERMNADHPTSLVGGVH